MAHPEVSNRSCEDCKKWAYDDTPKGFGKRRMGRDNKPQPRPPQVATPCHMCPKIPPDIPAGERKAEHAVEMTDRSWRAYRYYRLCQVDTTGLLPRDQIVLKNNAIIRMVEESVNREQGASSLMILGLGKQG